MRPLVIGTRGSALALWQARWVADRLRDSRPGVALEVRELRTRGDTASSAAAAGPGAFTGRIEQALQAGRIDLAVHSFKDLPTRPAEGLAVAAVPTRADPADALVAAPGAALAALPRGARVLTGSVRRRALLRHRRPDLDVRPVRGNVPTRLRKLDESGADALVVARAALLRLGLAGRIAEWLDPVAFVPACAQGALAVQVRADDAAAAALAAAIDHAPSHRETVAERAFLAELGAGCHAPAGAYARPGGESDALTVTGMVASPDGSRLLTHTLTGRAGAVAAAEALGRALADALARRGGRDILENLSAGAPGGPERPA
jgi:hydroxymethylbilane synthase